MAVEAVSFAQQQQNGMSNTSQVAECSAAESKPRVALIPPFFGIGIYRLTICQMATAREHELRRCHLFVGEAHIGERESKGGLSKR